MELGGERREAVVALLARGVAPLEEDEVEEAAEEVEDRTRRLRVGVCM